MDIGSAFLPGRAFDDAFEFAAGLEDELIPDSLEVPREAGGEAVVEGGVIGPDVEIDGGVAGRGAGGALDVHDVFVGVGGDVIEGDGVFTEADMAFDVIEGIGEVSEAHAGVVAEDIAVELEVARAADAFDADGNVELAVRGDALDEVLAVGEGEEEGRVVVAEDGVGEADVEIEGGIGGGAGDGAGGLEIVVEEAAAHIGIDAGVVHAEAERTAECRRG